MTEKPPIPPTPDKKTEQELSPEQVKAIGKAYGLSQLEVLERISEGKLNKNFHAKDAETNEDYFLREHRHDNKPTIEKFHASERFFASHNIPVVVAMSLADKDEEAVYEQGGNYYSLYPWVEGKVIKGELSETALASIASLQAEIHLLSKDEVPQGLSDKKAIGWDKKQFQDDIDRYERMIRSNEQMTEFDELALEVIQLQKQVVEANDLRFEDMDLGKDHLIHGDIQKTNIFFGENDEVKHLFDSEHVQYSARALEVVKSLDLMVFSQDYTDEDFEDAEVFLKAYHEKYPLDRQEFENAIRAYFLRFAHYTWKLREHYDNDNTRVDRIFKYDKWRLEFMIKHLDAFIEKTVGLVFENE